MNDTIETLGIFAISGLPTTVLAGTVSTPGERGCVKKHERVNAFNLVDLCNESYRYFLFPFCCNRIAFGSRLHTPCQKICLRHCTYMDTSAYGRTPTHVRTYVHSVNAWLKFSLV